MLEIFSLTSFAVAVLASATGSLHCLAMCGPIRWLAGTSPWAGARYQAGRLVAYLTLGILAGAAGAALPLWALVPLAVVELGLQFLPHASPWAKARGRLIQAFAAKPWLVGFVSAALPCGLLHGWVAAAAATFSPWRGGALLFCLWLGSVPALEASVRALRQPAERLRQRFPRALPLAFLLLALVPIGLRLAASAPPSGVAAGPSCHQLH